MKRPMVNIPSTFSVYSENWISLPKGAIYCCHLFSCKSPGGRESPDWVQPMLVSESSSWSRWLLGGITLGLRSDYNHKQLHSGTYSNKKLAYSVFLTCLSGVDDNQANFKVKPRTNNSSRTGNREWLKKAAEFHLHSLFPLQILNKHLQKGCTLHISADSGLNFLTFLYQEPGASRSQDLVSPVSEGHAIASEKIFTIRIYLTKDLIHNIERHFKNQYEGWVCS